MLTDLIPMHLRNDMRAVVRGNQNVDPDMLARLNQLQRAQVTRDIAKKIEKLPEFFPSYLDDVPLPNELRNEPFALVDTKLRPEIRLSRRRFVFEIEGDSRPVCTVGSSVIRGTPPLLASEVPVNMKRRSNVSVLSVYETYGLEIAYSYLHFLYTVKYLRYAPQWLTIYLLGSLLEIEGRTIITASDPGDKYKTLYLCSTIMRALEHRDSMQPKLRSPLRSVPEGTLPPDVLSRILDSTRVSKTIAKDVRGERCNAVPHVRSCKT